MCANERFVDTGGQCDFSVSSISEKRHLLLKNSNKTMRVYNTIVANIWKS